MVKDFVAKFNDQDEPILNILSLYIINSYFFDKPASLFYLLITGDNDTGKASFGKIFHTLDYRVVIMTDPTEAIYYLGHTARMKKASALYF